MSLDRFKPWVRGHFNSEGEVYYSCRYLLRRYDNESVERIASATGGPLIVGEAPGPNTLDECPMLPYPSGSAGGRLMAISGMSPADYLATYRRTNLLRSLPKTWSEPLARQAAVQLLLAYPAVPLVLLGTRVGKSFGATSLEPVLMGDRWVASLPHPSGRNPALNSESVKTRCREVLWRMAELWHNPLGPFERRWCEQCGRLARVHVRYPGDPSVFVLCSTEAGPRLARDVG